jgi:hypothetical protein
MRNRLVTVGLATVLLVGAACGSKTAKTSTAATAGSSAPAAGASSSASSATTKAAIGASSSAADASPTTTAAKFSGDGKGPFCAEIKSASLKLDDAATGNSSADLKASLNEVLELYGRLESKAPAELKPDIKAIIEGIGALNKAYSANGYDIAKVASDPNYASDLSKYSTSVEPAIERMAQYSEKVCGIAP